MRGANRTYVCEVRLGRKKHCEVQVESGVVSRVHAKIVFEDGRWWVIDVDSTNGTHLDGEAIDRAPLPVEATVHLSENGPQFRVTRPQAADDETAGAEVVEAESTAEQETAGSKSATKEPTSSPGRAPRPEAKSPDASVSQYVRHYFEGEEGTGGEHTRMLRQAYERVQEKERRQYLWVMAGVLALCVILGGYAAVQHIRNEQHEETAKEVFAELKELEADLAQLRQLVEERGDAALQKQVSAVEEQHQERKSRYQGLVKDLGVYRELSAREREIYQTARIFGESEFSIPAGFIRRVNETIEGYWEGPARSDYVNAIQHAEEEGYTSFIVKTLREHGLPPEFFYLALQESRFRVDAVGPKTRWGIAKGMWQLIPSTAREYGLRVGPRADVQVVDSQDERHDFEKSTRAAARYLQTIYSTKARASGLLVVASYNWGEHRVVDRLERLPGPQSIPDEVLEGVPEDPRERNYWQFLTEYDSRMPAETKEYVLKVFSAAVIGGNPELFGFDFENPLVEHMEASSVTAARARDGPF